MKLKLFPHHWPFVRGIHRSPVVSPNKGPIVWADVSLMLDRRNCLPNTQMAGDRGHYDAHVTSLEWNFALYIKICYTHLSHYSDRRHNERDGFLNHRCLDCLLNRLFRHSSWIYLNLKQLPNSVHEYLFQDNSSLFKLMAWQWTDA